MIALVTGGSGGIGRHAASRLLALRYQVYSPSRSEVDWQASGCVDTLELRAPVDSYDVMVFCHGAWYSELGDWTLQYLSRVVYPLEATRRFLRPGGVAVFVSSTRAFIGGIESGSYAMACAAQVAMAIGLSREDTERRYHVVCPGLTRTKLGEQVIATGGAKPGAPMLEPEWVADVILDLVNEPQANGRVVRVVARADIPGAAIAPMAWKEV